MLGRSGTNGYIANECVNELGPAVDIAKGIARAISKGKHEVYLPWFWRIIMGIIIHIPHVVFNKLSL